MENQPERTDRTGNQTKEEHGMKKGLMALIAGAVIAMAGTAMAASTNNLTVQATVTGACKFSNATSTLDFGALDPTVGGNVTPTPAIVNFWCTKGVTTDAITANNGNNFSGGTRRMTGVSGDFIPYSLTLAKDANPNAGPTSPRSLTVSGQILGTDYTGVSAGNYSDSVILSINP